MEEVMSFNYTIVLGFGDLCEELENNIYTKLSEQDFFNTSFEVIHITNFIIKEMVVSGNVVLCKLWITANCNNPSIGKKIRIDEFQIKNNGSLIYSKGRIQIIAKIPQNMINNKSFIVKIEAVKLVTKNILCVAAVEQ